MKTRLIALASGGAVIAALSVGIASATAAGGATHMTCTARLTSQAAPGAPSGSDFGFVSCPSPLGSGLQFDTYQDTVNGNNVSVAGPYKLYFDTGTIHGLYKLAGTTTGTTLRGTGTIKGGTGAFGHASGSVKLTCTGAANSNKTSCSVKLTVTGI